MNILADAVATAPRNPWAREIRYEFLRLLRTPGFALPTLLFPPMFYVLFALLLPMGRSGNWQAAHYLLATYTVFGVMAPGLFGFGATVAVEREQGWLRLKRAAPMPAGAWLLAKAVMAVGFALLVFAIMAALAAGAGGVRLPASAWLALAAVAGLGVLPFCAAGLWIGLVASAQAAPAIVNLVYLPMAFLSGLWFPLMLLPAPVQAMAPLWPAYHLGQLALAAVGQGSSSAPALHALALLAFGGVFAGLAARALRRA
ncbi:MAG: ABC transporter permease [Xanthomonadales bacterium]|nr:ABC transporter permease [Xanthomonadales bacterium]